MILKDLLNEYCKRRIDKIHYLHLMNFISTEEAEEKSFFWNTIRAKWVLDQCHHLCALCEYKCECWGHAKEYKI